MRHRGQRVCLPASQVEEVRTALLEYAERSGQTLGQIAMRCRLRPSTLYDFVGYRTHSIRVIGALADNLPLGVVFDRPRIRRAGG